MAKKFYSTHNDFTTGLLSKITITLGVILLILFIFLKTIAFFFAASNNIFFSFVYGVAYSDISGSMIAFSVLLIGVGVILCFIHTQFAKLAEIASEVEKNEDLKVFKKEEKNEEKNL
ncbi:MAG: hypothetical protein V5A64_02040 [Candidatus Thermoplasmatota archaeon]